MSIPSLSQYHFLLPDVHCLQYLFPFCLQILVFYIFKKEVRHKIFTYGQRLYVYSECHILRKTAKDSQNKHRWYRTDVLQL